MRHLQQVNPAPATGKSTVSILSALAIAAVSLTFAPTAFAGKASRVTYHTTKAMASIFFSERPATYRDR